jgi:hypothetical protein
MISDTGLDSTRLSMYKQAQESLNRYVSDLLPHEELQAEISNKVLLSLIHEEAEIPNIDAWIRKKTDIFLESCIKTFGNGHTAKPDSFIWIKKKRKTWRKAC